MGRTQVDQLSDEERGRFNEWADKWIEVGLRTGPADRERFEASVRDCYRFAGIPFPEVVVWVPSPLVMAFAAPAAALAIALIETTNRSRPLNHAAVSGAVGGAVRGAVGAAVDGAVRDAVDGAVRDAVDAAVRAAVRDAVHDAVDGAVDAAVDDAVRGAVHGAVRDAVDGAVRGAVDAAVRGAVHGAVDGAVRAAVGAAVRDAVDGAVDGAVGGAVDDAVRDAVDGAVRAAVRDAVHDAVDGAEIQRATLDVIARSWSRLIGGQFWVGGWWYGGAWTSFFREVCGLELDGDLWDRARAYEGTMESACWWWPHRRFVMVCERPSEIHRELPDPAVERGWGSHRLHREDGPAVVWPDGWGVYSWHGVRVPADVIEHPEAVTADRIIGEENVEVRRAILEKVGYEPLTSVAVVVDADVDQYGRLRELLRIDQADDEAIVLVRVVNSTPEPDGSFKEYVLRVPPSVVSAQEAVAWTFDLPADSYLPLVET